MSMYESAEEQALAAAELLGAELEYDADDPTSWSLQLTIEPEGRQHRVFVFPIEETERSAVHMAEEPGFVCASAIVGPLNERVDLNFCLSAASHMVFARVTIREIDGQDTVMVEGSLPLMELNPAFLAALIEESALLADSFEERFFGIDED